MRYLLCGINAKYIHSNLAVFCLKAYAECHGPQSAEYIIKEYTINQYVEDILADLYLVHADVIIFSCYIWNVSYVRELAGELKKICPGTPIWVGGPEVSYHAESFLEENPAVDLVMQGEGEEQFCALVELMERNGNGGQLSLSCLPCGVVICMDSFMLLPKDNDWISEDDDRVKEDHHQVEEDYQIMEDHIQVSGYNHQVTELQNQCLKKVRPFFNTGFAPVVDMDRIPFVYDDFQLFDHKIIYYETSRGCPFSCSYCLSSIDKTVRFRSLHLVLPELQRFLDAGVPQVKFVDRTFNCRKSHAMAIWSYIHEHDNGVTNFHFEISADLLDDEEMDLFEKMRPGLIQLEIGVQSTYGPAIEAIHRHMDLKALFAHVDRVHAMGNIHQHLDLIAGLPFETYEHFRDSFNDLYLHAPDQLQLGFLKVLKGTCMEERQEEYGMCARSLPPYEVLQTRWLRYDEILRLKGVEEMVETYYNSMQYTSILKYTVPAFLSPFDFYETLSTWYRDHDLHKRNHNRLEKYEVLRDFLLHSMGAEEMNGDDLIQIQTDKAMVDARLIDEMLLLDMYLREKIKKRPSWAPDQKEDRKEWRRMFRDQGDRLFPEEWGMGDYDSKRAENQSHIERFSFDPLKWIKDGRLAGGEYLLLFDYRRRDPLSYNALIRNIDSMGSS